MRKILTSAFAGLAVAFAAGTAAAGTLENMERERALLIEAMLDPSLGPAERQSRFEAGQRRLVDLERMVLRDESLKGRNTPAVRRAFANYDLTFLFHAGLEKKMAPSDLWLEQVGVSTQSLMAAKKGFR
jgi:hypothetical protein